jgi:uncharacterized protein (DUF362 family)
VSWQPARLTRREFVSAAAALAAAGCRRPRYRPGDFIRPVESPVAIMAAADYGVDLGDIITRGLNELRVDLRGARVLLKPNLVEFEPGSVINTHPAVIVGAAVACRRLGARHVVVAEGPGHRRDLEYLLESTGTLSLLREERLAFVDLNHDDVARVPLRTWYTALGSLALPQTLLDADVVVSLPKLKTHHWAGLTCAMKNFFGVVPGAVYGWPKNVLHVQGIAASILDIVATVRPHLAIVDGIVGMEGDGPILGTPKPVGALIIGRDLVAVDATAARVMALRPDRVPYLAEAGTFLGHIDQARIPMRGEALPRFVSPFEVLAAFEALRA